MLIMPAIDLRGGACVRLLHGRFDAATQYGDPLTQLRSFAAAGAAWVHIVDLDGAERGAPQQQDLIAKLAQETKLKVQVGGGVRERAHVASLFEAGVDRVVVGSLAVRNPERVREWIDEFGPERIVVALDVRSVAGGGWEVVVDGWREGAGVSLEGALWFYPPGTLKHVLVTDISRDGAMKGPNAALIASVVRGRGDIALQASGGVGRLRDLLDLRKTGASACIIGRALYERRFSLEDALGL